MNTLNKTIAYIISLLLVFSFELQPVQAGDSTPKPEEPTALTETNAFSDMTSVDELVQKMPNWPELNQASIQHYNNVPEYGTYKVPGLLATHSLENDKKRSICTIMAPQGLCLTEKYLLISAYCHNHNHNSVIYVIDRETKQYVKEIILPGKPHVGGIAYDTNRQEIWVCSKKSGIPQLCVFSLSQLEEYNSSKEEPITFKFRYSIPILSNASYMSYDNDVIYVGSFSYDDETDCRIAAFSLTKPEEEEESKSGRYFHYEGTTSTYTRIQGMAVHNDKFFFTRSVGPINDSHLDVFNLDTKDIKLKEAEAIYGFPERLEQVYFDGDDCYCIFESGSNAYNKNGTLILDRVLVFSIQDLLSIKPNAKN